MECPACRSHKVQRSRRIGLKEGLVLRMLSRAPYRCGGCGSRFIDTTDTKHYRLAKNRGLSAYLGLRSQQQKKLARVMAIIVLGAILGFLLMLVVRDLSEFEGSDQQQTP
jgi:hypothetical protein